jgi:hypothetical protein
VNILAEFPNRDLPEIVSHRQDRRESGFLHPAWRRLIQYCADLEYGEIEKLKIQDGLPMAAEVTTKKIKFGS